MCRTLPYECITCSFLKYECLLKEVSYLNFVKRVRSMSSDMMLVDEEQDFDLIPIQHLWDGMKQDVKCHNTAPTNRNELWIALANIWQVIPMEPFQKLVVFMPRRVASRRHYQGQMMPNSLLVTVSLEECMNLVDNYNQPCDSISYEATKEEVEITDIREIKSTYVLDDEVSYNHIPVSCSLKTS
ncbi:hypothetical protein TNCV_4309281 [Trichonephila clavipes]|nr:hypothetical protein TNCV_4309281 [Trichonephila clavipes]